MSTFAVRYLLFDIESVADGRLVADVRYPGEDLTPEQAITAYRGERMEQFNSEFIPYTFHVPVSVAVIKIAADMRIIDIVTLDDDQYRPHIITKYFWEGWRAYQMPTFISFNGRTFDIPLMELAAFRYGIAIPDWFNLNERSYDQKRNRYNQLAHFDLQDIITNFGATRLNGGLNLLANILGKPGKMGIAGHMVQDLYDDGHLKQINDYCRCDVLDTYFVFLRTKVLVGELSLEQEMEIVSDTKNWLAEQASSYPIYSEYLGKLKEWENPWTDE